MESETEIKWLTKEEIIGRKCSPKHCDYLHRICSAMWFCANISISKFIQFNTEIYTNFLDDYIHIVKTHDNNFSKISMELIEKYGCSSCDVSQCQILTRHYQRNRGIKHEHKTDKVTEEMPYRFYAGLYDQTHHLIFHLFALGLRTETTDSDDKHMENEEHEDNMNYLCIDSAFKKKKDLVQSQRKKYGFNLDRYNETNNKFNLHVQHHKSALHSTETVLDSMYEKLKSNMDTTNNQLIQLQKYIDVNEYDTDSISNDLDEYKDKKETVSNICSIFDSSFPVNVIINYIKFCQLSETSFSTGFIFFYENDDCNWDEKQIGDWLNGYSKSDLYVPKHYNSLKKEILESGFLSIDEWKRIVTMKAKKYYKTEKVRSMKSCQDDDFFDMTDDESILLEHLYAIILYCDWTDLCTHFSNTFRNNSQFESLQSVRKRHSKYYYFGKLLAEAVNNFGIHGCVDNRQNYLNEDTYEDGPFYCGLSVVLNIPSFAIHLKGPCSTSKVIEIAINFAKRDGIIIKLQNDMMNEGAHQTFFDCSWISNYAEENERLFIAGNYRLRIESILIIESGKNFEKYFHAFYLFDAMISGVNMSDLELGDSFRGYYESQMDIISSDIVILEKLISNHNKDKFDPYIENVWHLFLNMKTQIIINIVYLRRYFGDLVHLILHSKIESNSKDFIWDNDTIDAADKVKEKIFIIFPNLNLVAINSDLNLQDQNESFWEIFDSKKWNIECGKKESYYLKINKRV
eukprot:165602_1